MPSCTNGLLFEITTPRAPRLRAPAELDIDVEPSSSDGIMHMDIGRACDVAFPNFFPK
jgi:hypothetical protein